MKVHVTQEDIETGEPGDPYNCAVALAIKRELGLDNLNGQVKIASGFILFLVDHVPICHEQVPDEAREFILKFDREEELSPIEFELRGPSIGDKWWLGLSQGVL
jgi:hypothetical protein